MWVLILHARQTFSMHVLLTLFGLPTSHSGLPHLLPILRHGGLPCSDVFSAKLYRRERKEREVEEGQEEDVRVLFSSQHTGFQNEQCYSSFHT